MNTKKSKFQERLDTIAKNYDPEEDRGEMNDKVNLHRMTDSPQTLTEKDINQLIKAMKGRKIPYQLMVAWNRDRGEGFNDGINTCIVMLERRLKRIQKTHKVKLHNTQTGT